MVFFYSTLIMLMQVMTINLLFASGSIQGQRLIEVNVDISVKDMTLLEVLNEIENKTQFKFSYTEDEIPLEKRLTLDIDGESLYEVLEAVSAACNLVFNRINNQIVVIRKAVSIKTNKKNVINEVGAVRGKIKDKVTGELIFGANVILEGTELGSSTGFDGKFQINKIPVGEYKLKISYIGYKSITEKIKIVKNKIVEVNFELQPSLVNLDELVVTGSMAERKIKESANPITIITGKELENRDVSSLNDILKVIPGVIPTDGSDTGSKTGKATTNPISTNNVRGVATLGSGSGASGVKVLLDGVEVTNDKALDFLDPNQIEKIEIIRGPMATTLYGAGASGGIIQIFTKSGFGKMQVSLRSRISILESDYHDESKVNQEHSIGINGGNSDYGYNVSLNHNFNPAGRFKKNNGIDEKIWSAFVGLYASFSDVKLDFKFQHSKSEFGTNDPETIKRIAEKQQWKNWETYPTYPLRDDRNSNKTTIAGLNATHVITNNLYHKFLINHSRFDGENMGFSPMKDFMTEKDYYLENSYGSEMTNFKYFINYDSKVSNVINLDLTAGFDYSKNDLKSYTIHYANPPSEVSNDFAESPAGSTTLKEGFTKAFFAETVVGINENLNFTIGFRTEQNAGYGDDVGWVSMPRFGVAYVLEMDDLIVKPRASWGKSTQAPDPLSKVRQETQYTLQLANPDLKPQVQKGWEAGADVYLSTYLTVGITYYDQLVEDMINFKMLGLTDDGKMKFQYANFKEVENYGLELSAKFQYDRFLLSTAYTSNTSVYGNGFPTKEEAANGMSPNIYTGARILGIPYSTFTSSLTYYFPALFGGAGKSGSLTLEYYHLGKVTQSDYIGETRFRTENPGQPAKREYKEFDGYGKWNLRGNVSLLDNLVLFVDIMNLFNKQTVMNSGPLRGRSISIGSNLIF
ncbi:MAG: TonB-dependent receptor domain-containing protein [Rhodothermaceae bacterium]